MSGTEKGFLRPWSKECSRPAESRFVGVRGTDLLDRRAAHVAQSVEHLHGKQKVIGSNPIVGSISRRRRE